MQPRQDLSMLTMQLAYLYLFIEFFIGFSLRYSHLLYNSNNNISCLLMVAVRITSQMHKCMHVCSMFHRTVAFSSMVLHFRFRCAYKLKYGLWDFKRNSERAKVREGERQTTMSVQVFRGIWLIRAITTGNVFWSNDISLVSDRRMLRCDENFNQMDYMESQHELLLYYYLIGSRVNHSMGDIVILVQRNHSSLVHFEAVEIENWIVNNWN